MSLGGATFDAKRDRFLFNYCSYLGGESYRLPPPTTLSTATVSWTRTADGVATQPVTETKRYNSFLVPHPAESDKSFETRLALAAYIGVPELIVDAYAEGVTSSVSRQLGPIEEYAQDIDLRGNAWGEFAEDCARWTCVYGMCATVIDSPRSNGEVTRADEQSSGMRPYCVLVHPSAWAWVDVDGFGQVTEFAYVDQPYVQSVNGGTSSQTITVRIYCAATTVDGVKVPGKWRVARGTVAAGASLGSSRALFDEVVSEGELDPRLEGRVPVVFSYYRRDSSTQYPVGLSLIDSACDLARVIYNKRSWEQQIAREAGFPTLAIPLAGTGGHMDPATQRTIGPSKALGYDSSTGAPSWIQPSSEWAKDLRESCMQDFQLALRSAGLELAADASSQVQSGEALRVRSRDFESRAKRFARHMQRWETAVLKLVALFAGADHTEITITYPKRFTLPDLAGDLARALTVLNPTQMPIEIGRTARLAAAIQALDAALVLSDEEQSEVRAQMESVLDEDVADFAANRELSTLARDAKKAELTPEPEAEAKEVTAVTVDQQAKDPQAALNGAQVSSLLEIVTQVATRQIPRDTGIGLILAAFPLTAQQAEGIMGAVGRSFYAPDPAAAAAAA